jgi:predicted phage terminase large subunit-like protein
MHVVVPMGFKPERSTVTPFAPSGYDPRKVKGESLHPTRFTEEYLAEERVRLGAAGYGAQYEQDGDALKGSVIDRGWFRFFCLPGQHDQSFARPRGAWAGPSVELKPKPERGRKHPSDLDLDWVIISVDATFGSLTDSASNVGLLVVGGKDADRFVLADRTKPMTFNQTLAALATFDESTRKLNGGLCFEFPQAKKVLIEKKANGAAVLEVLGSKVPGLVPYVTSDGKVARARAMSPAIESGNVYLLDGANWVEPFLDELAMFPNASKDDRVDTLSQVLDYVGSTSSTMARWEALAK